MEIYDHDSPELIAFKNKSIELENWIEHLNYIDKEITHLLNLSKSEGSKDDSHPVISKLKNEQADTAKVINAFLNYRESLPKAAECEDVDCDMFYVGEHEKFRKNYTAHLKKYREVKEEYFRILTK